MLSLTRPSGGLDCLSTNEMAAKLVGERAITREWCCEKGETRLVVKLELKIKKLLSSSKGNIPRSKVMIEKRRRSEEMEKAYFDAAVQRAQGIHD